MNLLLKRLLPIVLLILSSMTVVYSDVCCYVDGDIEYSDSQSSCESQGVYLGDQQASISGNRCEYIENDRVSCNLKGSSECTNFIGGNALYDNSEILTMIGADEYCESYERPYDSSCSETNVGNQIGGGQSGSGNQDGTPTQGEDSTTDDNSYEEIGDELNLAETCESIGGSLFGFFNEKLSCESVSFGSQGNPCLYNPYRGGIFSSILHYEYPESLDRSEEPACVPKSRIRTCSDYKTQNNCESNKALEGNDAFTSNSPDLQYGCSWIPAEEYASSLNNQANGMCVSKVVEEKVDYDADEYAKRTNLLKNPLFREGLSHWTTTGSLDTRAYDGDSSALKLINGQSLTQEISNLGSGNVYIPSLHVKFLSSGSLPEVKITQYNKSGSIIGSPKTPGYTISPEVKINSTYKEVLFEPTSISSSATKINFTIEAKSDIVIDTLSLQPPQSGIGIAGIFFPVDLIRESASFCSQCFDPLGFNTCTLEKSNSLGACSYMVSDPGEKYSSSLSDYAGKSENVHMEDEKQWTSQSIASSQLFCEMYVSKNSCEDKNNFVNEQYSSLHIFSDPGRLCKWDAQLGCFKDSNNDNEPDVLKGVIKSQNNSNAEKAVFNSPSLEYRFNSNSNGPSDFAVSCDTIPPIVYSYITAKTSDGDTITLDDLSYDELIGNVSIQLDIKDTFPNEHACSPYADGSSSTTDDVNQRTYVILSGGNQAPKFEVSKESSQTYNLKDELPSLEGQEDVEVGIMVVDQSGNVGANRSLQLNVDLFSPSINPSFSTDFNGGTSNSSSYNVYEYLTKESQVSFDISDKGGINSCSYQFEPSVEGQIEGNFEEQVLDVENGSSEFSFSFNISDYISSISPTGGSLELNINCSDIFGQKTSQKYFLLMTGDIFIQSPKPFLFDTQNYDSEKVRHKFIQGFYNEAEQDVELYISREDIDTCTFGGSDLVITTGPFENVANVDGSFATKATGSFEFEESQESQREYEVLCRTDSGSQFGDTVTYFYEEEKPVLNSYKLLDELNSSFYDENSNTWYSIEPPKQTIIGLEIDGTKSWIDQNYSLYLNEEKIDSGVYGKLNYQPYNQGHNFVSNATISGFDFNPETQQGAELIAENVQKYGLTLELLDKAGNKNNESLSYVYDATTPEITFGGEIMSQIDGGNSEPGLLFTSVKDPIINVTFNTPNYREFNCQLELNDGGTIYNPQLGLPSNHFTFKLSDILDQNIDVSQDDISLSMNCEEILFDTGEPRNSQRTYEFVFDNTEPVLNDVYFKEGQKRYFGTTRGLVLDEIVDDLVYEFNDTNERSYTCEYKVKNIGQDYACNNSIESRRFGGELNQELSLNMLVGFEPKSGRTQIGDNFRCYQRTQSFWRSYDLARELDESHETQIEISTQCEDAVGFKTQEKSTTLDIIYASSSIADVSFNFEDGKAKPIISMLSDTSLEGQTFVFNHGGERIFESTPVNSTRVGESYEVTFGDSGIDVSGFFEGEYELLLEVYSGGRVIDKKNVMLSIDSTAPTANLRILDDFDGEVDSPEFKVDFSAVDSGVSGVDEVELYVTNRGQEELLFSNSFNDYSYDYTDEEPFIKKSSKGEFTGSFFFQGELGEEYNFTLITRDGAGNENSSHITTTIVNEAYFQLNDTSTSKVSLDPYTILTRTLNRNQNLTISAQFHPAGSCDIYPFRENNLSGVSDKGDFASTSIAQSFTMDLIDTFVSFSMEKAQSDTIILYFECDQDGNKVQFRRELTKVVGLPDYTLESTNGFYFNSENEEDYVTELVINSVGPYKQVKCQYNLANTPSSTPYGMSFSNTHNLIPQTGSTNQELNLVCEDLFGVKGPEKTYDFVVSLSPVQIGNVTLNSKRYSQTHNEEGETFHVAQDQEYILEFETNKRGVQCSYNIITTGSWSIGGVLGFFDNLFGIGSNSIDESQTPYTFTSEPISGINKDVELKIECGSASKSFNLDYIPADQAEIIFS